MNSTGKYPSLAILAIVCLALAVFLVGLNRTPIPTVDGAVRASEARHMVLTGELWPIHYQGKTITDHPPLFIWLTALSYKVFGINDFAANTVPRICAFLTVLFTAAIALEAGFGPGVALLTALLLVSTRDFVLSSVRGYIEPLLECCIYAGLWFVLRQKRKNNLWPAFGAAVAVWLAAYSKGPVALWPFLFFGFLFLLNGTTLKRKLYLTAIYTFSFVTCTALWAAWVTKNNQWPLWHSYLFGQVLSSALEGRGGAQQFEPFFFFKILGKFYWPWLPLLAWAFYKAIRENYYLRIFALLGLGFIGGFSLMKWKFWYYIAPAYPAFALMMACALGLTQFVRFVEHRAFVKSILYLSITWVFIGSIFPVSVHKERVPEVMAFKETIYNSDVPGPVWYLRDPMDHNMIGTSGEWYFDRIVEKVEPDKEFIWQQTLLKTSKPAWIITGIDAWKACQDSWCAKSKLIQSAGKSSLLYFNP